MEQEFNLLYYLPGITDIHLEIRTTQERRWLFKRLAEQKTEEAKKNKAASGK